MKPDKKRGFDEFLDKLSQGNMKGLWDHFNIY